MLNFHKGPFHASINSEESWSKGLRPYLEYRDLGNFLRRLALPRSISHWSLRTLQTKLIKIGAKVVKHARYTCFQMAEVLIIRSLFAAILRRIQRLMQPVPVRQSELVGESDDRIGYREGDLLLLQCCVSIAPLTGSNTL